MNRYAMLVVCKHNVDLTFQSLQVSWQNLCSAMAETPILLFVPTDGDDRIVSVHTALLLQVIKHEVIKYEQSESDFTV